MRSLIASKILASHIISLSRVRGNYYDHLFLHDLICHMKSSRIGSADLKRSGDGYIERERFIQNDIVLSPGSDIVFTYDIFMLLPIPYVLLTYQSPDFPSACSYPYAIRAFAGLRAVQPADSLGYVTCILK